MLVCGCVHYLSFVPGISWSPLTSSHYHWLVIGWACTHTTEPFAGSCTSIFLTQLDPCPYCQWQLTLPTKPVSPLVLLENSWYWWWWLVFMVIWVWWIPMVAIKAVPDAFILIYLRFVLLEMTTGTELSIKASGAGRNWQRRLSSHENEAGVVDSEARQKVWADSVYPQYRATNIRLEIGCFSTDYCGCSLLIYTCNIFTISLHVGSLTQWY